ncbi:cobyrinate a,c-diamide synthase [Micropruina sonneratiae]|uniref:cobyrinate a,c-diamide synthase n=1 Tax=Micropruina sonneratiae TaxID=2986940 RepID=UPI002227CED9|nr:cobyrinate a,c-diamide synthase [Micropruina sp. KQZ13P-5]MCW3158784.1 cobyrinate a,c-diamide synthase [Micropruina sp. KQZ13P-5]
MVTVPRLVIAAAASSAGKTTVATGLMAALRGRGVRVAGFKVGPDFIDPGYHALATGRPGRNLDPVLVGEHRVAPLFVHGATVPEPAEVAIVEGVMGLFDGRLGTDGEGSTAHVARLLDAPVVLVVDAAGSSRTAAAAALGLRDFDPRLRVAGAIVNRVGSARHGAELAAVLERAGVPVLGVLPRNAGISAPSRHLGLVPAAERAESRATIDALAEHLAGHVDLDAVIEVAGTAGELAAPAWDPTTEVSAVPGSPLVGVLAGRAFTFRYAETTELLVAAGCRVVEIDPLTDTALPAGIGALYAGGGFPEVHAAALSGNASLRAGLAAAIRDGLPTVAECAGQLYLCEHLDGHPMVGVLPASARMTPRLSLGYRTACAPAETMLAHAGQRVTGHEFHRTLTTPGAATPAWSWDARTDGFSLDPAGRGSPTLHTGYLHLHYAGHPALAHRLANAASGFAPSAPRPAAPPAQLDGIALRHHGDRDLAPGLVDLAVNVQLAAPPPWLADVIGAETRQLGAYPDVEPARRALAERHGVEASMVLPTNGAAEAFALVAGVIGAANPMVVHPQFTEPEAALRAAGLAVQRWLLPVRTGAGTPALGELPAWADALFVGNPTNPTGWLHRAQDLLAAQGDRVLVVDEAFMDATDEAESLIASSMPGRLVVRSLSKTWGLAGLRVGYLIGDPELIKRAAAVQPAWSVSSPAIAAMIATAAPDALAEARARHAELAERRERFAADLAAAGFPSVTSVAPFLLIDTAACGPLSVRPALAEAGFAVRRAETFPGLGPTWIRAKVPHDWDAFVDGLARLHR